MPREKRPCAFRAGWHDVFMDNATQTASIESARDAARRIIAKGPSANPTGLLLVVGKLWYNSRRWSWVLRGQSEVMTERFEDGCRFEGIEIVK